MRTVRITLILAYLGVSSSLPLPFTRLRLRLSDRDSCDRGSELMWKYSMSIQNKCMHTYFGLILVLRIQFL